MKSNEFAVMALLGLLAGCATGNSTPVGGHPSLLQITIPNGSSPAKANAARAPMNDTDAMREGWNYGNGALWVYLNGVITPDGKERDGSLRVKFGWWRGIPGRFSIEGRRLDAPAPPLRSSFETVSRGAFGFTPSYLYFPTTGFWEITGRIDDQSLTFVVKVVDKAN